MHFTVSEWFPPFFLYLYYNSEAWDLYTEHDFKTWDSSPIEKVQQQFCKRYLETNNKASYLAYRAEIGRFPLIININEHILNYILYLKNKDDESLLKQMFLTSVDLNSVGKRSVYSNLTNIVDFYNLNNFNLNTLDENKINHYNNLMKQKDISYWKNAVQYFNKLEFYNIFQ